MEFEYVGKFDVTPIKTRVVELNIKTNHVFDNNELVHPVVENECPVSARGILRRPDKNTFIIQLEVKEGYEGDVDFKFLFQDSGETFYQYVKYSIADNKMYFLKREQTQ